MIFLQEKERTIMSGCHFKVIDNEVTLFVEKKQETTRLLA